jgi:hypothetical protein
VFSHQDIFQDMLGSREKSLILYTWGMSPLVLANFVSQKTNNKTYCYKVSDVVIYTGTPQLVTSEHILNTWNTLAMDGDCIHRAEVIRCFAIMEPRNYREYFKILMGSQKSFRGHKGVSRRPLILSLFYSGVK